MFEMSLLPSGSPGVFLGMPGGSEEQTELIGLLRSEKTLLLEEVKKLNQKLDVLRAFAQEVTEFSCRMDTQDISVVKIDLLELKQSVQALSLNTRVSQAAKLSLEDRRLRLDAWQPHYEHMQALAEAESDLAAAHPVT